MSSAMGWRGIRYWEVNDTTPYLSSNKCLNFGKGSSVLSMRKYNLRLLKWRGEYRIIFVDTGFF